MSSNFEEVYYIIEEAIELAFNGQFVIKLYEYFQSRGVTKAEADQFLNSSTANEIASVVVELDEYIKGCLLYTSPSPRDLSTSRMPSSA